MKALVLGGEGFIGSHLVERLVASGHEVRVLSRRHGLFIGEGTRARAVFFRGDFADRELLARAIDGCQVVFHLASTTIPQTSNLDPVHDVQSNLVGTLGLLDLAVQAKVRKLVYVSSGGTVYGLADALPIAETHRTDPVCSYGIIKLAIEKYLHAWHFLHGLDYCVLRVANPYGERQLGTRRQGVIGSFVARMKADEPIEVWGDGEVVRDYLHVEDVARALEMAATLAVPAQVLNIGSGEGHSLNGLLAALGELAGVPPQVRYELGRRFDVPANVLDIGKAARVMGWQPEIPLAVGLRRLWLGADCRDNAAPRRGA